MKLNLNCFRETDVSHININLSRCPPKEGLLVQPPFSSTCTSAYLCPYPLLQPLPTPYPFLRPLPPNPFLALLHFLLHPPYCCLALLPPISTSSPSTSSYLLTISFSLPFSCPLPISLALYFIPCSIPSFSPSTSSPSSLPLSPSRSSNPLPTPFPPLPPTSSLPQLLHFFLSPPYPYLSLLFLLIPLATTLSPLVFPSPSLLSVHPPFASYSSSSCLFPLTMPGLFPWFFPFSLLYPPPSPASSSGVLLFLSTPSNAPPRFPFGRKEHEEKEMLSSRW
jgi:hypothetical protein